MLLLNPCGSNKKFDGTFFVVQLERNNFYFKIFYVQAVSAVMEE